VRRKGQGTKEGRKGKDVWVGGGGYRCTECGRGYKGWWWWWWGGECKGRKEGRKKGRRDRRKAGFKEKRTDIKEGRKGVKEGRTDIKGGTEGRNYEL
jgi:hypothetical protein